MKFKSFIINHKKVLIAVLATISTIGIGSGTIAYTSSQNQKQDELSAKIKELEKQLENVDSNETLENEDPIEAQNDEITTQSEQKPNATENNSTTINEDKLKEQIKEEVTKQLEEQKKEETTSSEKEDNVYPVKDKIEDPGSGEPSVDTPDSYDNDTGTPDVSVPDSYN